MNKYQEALDKIKYYEVSTSQGDEPLFYMLSEETKTLQELINKQQPNVNELIKKVKKIKNDLIYGLKTGTEKIYVNSAIVYISSILKKLEQLEQPTKTLEELGYKHKITKDDIKVYERKFRKGEELIHIGNDGYRNKFGCEMGDCVTIKFTDEELEILNMME